ncbi:MAG: protein kinase [Acidobacteriota bacterium]|nr:protein kinase [Blastocatellia bacterium]MDW8238132.1 protein kinase [Acidobacteriota bacterium]
MNEVKTDPLIGRVIAGRYEIEQKIGEGGMGSVYRARHIITGKIVAIKVLLEDLAAYDSFVQRFLHEAKAAAYLNHPHAINIIDCGRDGDVVYLLMEYVEGRTLKAVMRAEGPFSLERTSAILQQICAAVAAAHAQSIVHRDLKPDNIMLQQFADGTDYVKVLDFGIAKVLDEQKRSTQTPVSKNIFVGTPEYASPEQCNSKTPTHLSDIYSLGTIVYEMLTGRPVFIGEPMEVMLQHVQAQPPSLRHLRPDVPPAVEQVLMRALSKDPAERQQHVLELAKEFESAVYGGLVETSEPGVSGRNGFMMTLTPEPAIPAEVIATGAKSNDQLAWRRWFRSKRGRWLLAVSAGLLVVIAGAGFRFWHWYDMKPAVPAPPPVTSDVPLMAPVDQLLLTRELIENGDWAGALAELKRILANTEGVNPEAHMLLGRVYAEQGDETNAIRAYQTAIEQMGGLYPEAHYHYGQLLLERGELSQAERQFQQAVEGTERRHLPSLVALMDLALQRGETSVVNALFSEIISKAAETPDDWLQMGKASFVRGQYDYAARDLRRAIAAQPQGSAEAQMYLALTLARRDQFSEAREAFEQAISRRNGNYPRARFEFGKFLYEQGEVKRAVSELRAAVRLRGGHYPQAELALALALADWAVNRCDEAAQQLQLTISRQAIPFPEAEQALWRVYVARLGLLEEARKLSPRPEDRAWLEQRSEAILIESQDDTPVYRLISDKPLESGEARTYSLVPLARRGAYPTLALKIGVSALQLRWRAGEQNQSPRWAATLITPDGERLLDMTPVENHLMRKFAVEITVRVQPSSIALALDQQEVGQIAGDGSSPIQWSVTGGSVLVWSVRESKAMDNR